MAYIGFKRNRQQPPIEIVLPTVLKDDGKRYFPDGSETEHRLYSKNIYSLDDLSNEEKEIMLARYNDMEKKINQMADVLTEF